MDKQEITNDQRLLERTLVRKNNKCWFCEHGVEPDYKDSAVLKYFLTPRGKILPRKITSTCAGCQRKLSKAIKNARQMALIR